MHQEPFTVAVSQRVDLIQARNEQRDALDQRLVKWLWQVGAITLPVPNMLKSQGALVSWISAIAPKAVLLSGGNNIGEYPERDSTEFFLLNYAFENNLPALGICRGMQMMAFASGGKLERVEDHAGTRHNIYFDPVRKDTHQLEVNSFHEYRLKDCPVDFKVIARASDGTIEAIKHKTRRWEGWMWHPERETTLLYRNINWAKSLFFGS